MGASQMNIRMESNLKHAGNLVIAQQGYTPSQVVRALWEFAAIHDELPAALTRLLNREREDGADNLAKQDELMHGGELLVSSFYQQIGIPEPSRSDIDYDQLRELAAAEQLEKWGLA